jgi:pimeloyl-ACP methyl ester carboxylesterase
MDLVVDGKRAFAYTGGKPFDPKLPAVVFVHGAEHDHSVWALQSRYLAHHGRAVLAVDLPGHGRSAGPPLATVEALADWVLAVIAAAGLATAALVGHSMGALIVVEAAARGAERITRVATLGGTFPMRVSPELLEATRVDEPRAQSMINIWSHAAYAHFPGNPGPGTWVVGANTRLMQRQAPGVLHADFKACNDYAGGAAAAAKVACPVLAILAKRDAMTPLRGATEYAKSFKDVRIVEIAGSGHALMTEKPDEVLDSLLAFV